MKANKNRVMLVGFSSAQMSCAVEKFAEALRNIGSSINRVEPYFSFETKEQLEKIRKIINNNLNENARKPKNHKPSQSNKIAASSQNLRSRDRNRCSGQTKIHLRKI